jgi:hypothetical protein
MSIMSREFCRALDEGDLGRAKIILGEVVSTSELMRSDTDPNFSAAIKHVVDWLTESGCVTRASVAEGVLKSLPPQKILLLGARMKGQDRTLTLRLRLARHLEVHALED